MKRVVLGIGAVVILFGSGVAWWALRDTPEKVLRDGVQSLISLRSVGALTAELALTDVASRVTSGYSVKGRVNLTTVTRPTGFAVVRIGAKTPDERDETFEVVASERSVFLRPTDVTMEHRAEYEALIGTTGTETFLSFERDALIETTLGRGALPQGTPSAVRDTLRFALPTLETVSELRTEVVNGASRVTVDARFRFQELRALLITLVTSWTGVSPTPDQYAWIDRVVEAGGRGTWSVSIDPRSRAIVAVKGVFPLVNTAYVEEKRVTVMLGFEGVNESIQQAEPTDTLDVTSIIKAAAESSLSGAATREVPAGFEGGTVAPSADKTQIDLFSTLRDAAFKKRRGR